MRIAVRLSVFACFAGWASGCVAHGYLRHDLYSGDLTPPKVSASVVLIRQPGPAEHIRHKELPWASADIDLRGYPQVVASMLGTIYDRVSISSSAAQVHGADFIVVMSTDYPRRVGLTFQSGSGEILGSFSETGVDIPPSPEADSLIAKVLTPPGMVVSLGTLGFAFMCRAHDAGKRIGAAISDTTTKAISRLRERITATPLLAKSSIARTATVPAVSGTVPDINSSAEELEKAAERLRQDAAELEKRAKNVRQRQ